MSSPDRPLPPRAASRVLAPCCRLVACACAALLGCPITVSAQDRQSPLRLVGAPTPGGVRRVVTENWGTYDVTLRNLSDTDRQARVLLFHGERGDVQYGRDLWVPAHSTLKTWMLVGPPGLKKAVPTHDIEILLYDRTTGEDILVLPPGQERTRSKGMNYQPPAISTAILLDGAAPETPGFGQPESPDDEAMHLARTFRHAANANLSERVERVDPGPLPPTVEGLDGVHHFLLASGRIADDPAGMRVLRQWLQRGGRLWVMLDRIEPEVIAPLLGEALDFQVVDRVGLTTFTVETQTAGGRGSESIRQEHERPVDFVRVLLPADERVRHTIDGWPAWFTRQVGKGKIVFTTLGPRGLFRPRVRSDPPRRTDDPKSPYKDYADLPVPWAPLEAIARELRPSEDPFQAEAFEALLAEEIGYAVPSRVTVGLIFGAFVLATLGLGIVLRRSRRPELLGWLAPAAALGATGVLLLLGESSRRAVPPTVAVGQVVDAVSGTGEAEVHGLVAVYRPTSGPAEVGADQGGFFELDMTGIEGQTRRLVLTDMDAWHWENLSLPAGVRLAPFRYTLPTGEPIRAVARLGPDGIEGKLTTGPFTDLADAVLSTPADRRLAVRLRPDGTFSGGPGDVLPLGQFLSSAVLSDQQQRRQELYRKFLERSGLRRSEDRNVLLVWARPVDIPFSLAPNARPAGTALLVVPLQLERPAPGTRVTIPGPLLTYGQMVQGAPVTLIPEGKQKADIALRFQIPAAVLPLEVEGARFVIKINAPSRRVSISGQAGDPVDSPLDPVRVEIAEERFLRLDEQGGLRLNLTVSEPLKGSADKNGEKAEEKWSIEYLELEVTGRTLAPK